MTGAKESSASLKGARWTPTDDEVFDRWKQVEVELGHWWASSTVLAPHRDHV